MSTAGPSDLPNGRMDREAFLKEVGIHSRTLTRWIGEGVVEPQLVLRDERWVQTFTRADVVVARAVASLLRQRHGQFTLREIVASVKDNRLLPEQSGDPGHNEPRTPLTE